MNPAKGDLSQSVTATASFVNAPMGPIIHETAVLAVPQVA
jgi:hypothetical protein